MNVLQNAQKIAVTAEKSTDKPDEILRQNSTRLSIARFILIVLVIYVHFPLAVPAVRDIASFSILTPAYFANQTFLRFSVTILTVMSGFIMFAKESDRDARGTFNKKVRTLLIPFLFWNIPLVLVLFAAQYAGVLGGQRLNLVGADLTTWADALFAWSTRPVNYPLYFLRDLFVISIVAVLVSRVFRKYPVQLIVIAMIVAEYNLDGNLILRTPMLPAFFIGGAIAMWRVPLHALDKGFAPFALLLLGTCVAHYYFPSSNMGIYITILGGLTVWTGTSLLAKSRASGTLLALSKYSFPIYLIHGILLFGFLAVGIEVQPNLVGLLTWLIVPLVIAALGIAVFYVFRLIAPKTASFVTGGRGA